MRGGVFNYLLNNSTNFHAFGTNILIHSLKSFKTIVANGKHDSKCEAQHVFSC